MSYRGTRKGNHGSKRSRRANQGFREKKTKEIITTKFFGQPIITREKECHEEETPVPELVKEQSKISGAVNFGNSVGKIDVSGAKENTKETKYQKSMK